jgi:hypothetical protein
MPNLLNTLADNAELLLQNKENTLMSKLAVSVFSEKENKPD